MSRIKKSSMLVKAPGQAHDEADTFATEHRTNAANRQGTAVDGGTSRVISKGAWILVPENTPHSFTEIPDTFVIISLHVPKDGAAK